MGEWAQNNGLFRTGGGGQFAIQRSQRQDFGQG
jgi:hypothetical protein